MKIKLSQMGRRLSVLVGILTTMIASGCASQETAQQGPHTKTVADYTVTIKFVNGCPKEVTPPSQPSCAVKADKGICVDRGRSVGWVSDPAGTAFEVYFDPFVGQRYRSHGKDQTTTPVIVRRDSVAGVYKYSVLGVACTDGDPVLDPPIRVEH